jgi:hypothetical protein
MITHSSELTESEKMPNAHALRRNMNDYWTRETSKQFYI